MGEGGDGGGGGGKQQASPSDPPHLDVYQQPLHWPVRSVDHQVKVELLDEQELELQDLLQHPLLAGRGLLQQVAYKLSAGDVELVHFTGQVSTGQPWGERERGRSIILIEDWKLLHAFHCC